MIKYTETQYSLIIDKSAFENKSDSKMNEEHGESWTNPKVQGLIEDVTKEREEVTEIKAPLPLLG